jgi:hypothetical protein
MALKTYHGSCHCGAVQFEADIDFSQGTRKCNCSFCTKVRTWNVILKPEALRVISGEETMLAYRAGDQTPANHAFCGRCGVRTFDRGYLEVIGGDYVSVMVASLDDVSIDDMMSGPVGYSDGRNNNWMNPPADVRNL